ncbi:MAG: amino acid adenylation domain-containing protein [Jatrophihabitantaceae bacterium]
MSELAQAPSRLTDAQRQMLAARLRKGRNAEPDHIQRRPTGAEIPLSFAQEQLWFLDRFAPGLPTYNISHLMWLSGRLDLPALNRAITALVGRHESLRTRLVPGSGDSPQQVIDQAAAVLLPVIELAEPDLDRARAKVREFGTEQAVLPFDLTAGPLFRLHLLRLAEQEHALLVVVHHSVFDAWSLGVLLRELTACYDAEAAGRPAELPELPIQFGDYAIWERRRLHEPAPELIDYWRTALAGAQPLQLSTDRPRPPQESFRGEVQWLNLGTELLDELRALSRSQGCTLFGTLLSGLFALLHRYTGQPDIVIGMPHANRSREELAGLIGFLVNTLPIRAALSSDTTFGQLLQQVQQTSVSAYAHRDLPFAKLVQALAVPRDAGRSPVFQVVFTFAELADHPSPSDLALQLEKVDLAVAKFDLSFFAEVRPDGLWLELSYATDLFDAATITRMLNHYRRLLTGAAADPGLPLWRLPLLSEQELHSELVEFNETGLEIPAVCLHELFEAQARRVPEAIAAVGDAERISYRELDERANQLAGRLVELGIGPERLVGVCMQSSIDRLVALLAILKAGGGYLPLDPALPAQRLSFMLADAVAPLVITDQASLPYLPPTDALLLQVADAQACQPAEVRTSVTGSNAAYVIYTSGSTGQPKGVVVEHRNAVNFVQGQLAYWQLGTDDRVLQFSSLNFDVSVLDIFAALCSGATLVLMSAETRLSPPRLGALMREQRVSFGCLSPAMLSVLADQEFPDLRVLMSAGEELRSELAMSWLRPGLRLCNGYGPTEATVLSTFTEIDAGLLPPPIGRPPANYQAYVLDPMLNPVPLGVVGELHVGGAGVTRGYLNRPELTAARFITDPFNPAPEARLYKTGDLVKRLPDGNLLYVGRIDGQVKLHGQRIELGEVEAALGRLTGVRHAVVLVVEDRTGDRQLVGYVQRAPGAELEPAELKRLLGQWLPGYMVPSQLLVLDSLPMNSSGKVDRRALSAQPSSWLAASSTGRPEQAPESPAEAVLVDIYAGLLRLDGCSVLDSFFDVGGNSLQAMQLLSRIRAGLGVDLPLTAVFLAPTPRGLAARIEAEQAGTAQPARGPVALLSEGVGIEPLFLVHAVGGTVLPYTQLAAELADRYQVYGIQAAALVAPSPPVAQTLPELAARYLAELRTIQPAGPYRIGGWSMGGLLAHEIVRQLERDGETVELMILLDAPFAIAEDTADSARITREFMADALRSLGLPALDQPESDGIETQLARLAQALDPTDSDRAATVEQLRRRLAVFTDHRRLMAGYRPVGQVRATTLLVGAQRSPNAKVQPDWLGIIGGTLCRPEYDTDHYALLQLPHVRDIAAQIRSAVMV